ncbi:MAG: hypothetical protein ACE5I7_12385 [Candidatus Binatia bacterium]
MPAVTLGLAEVEERLRALRRRLNVLTLVRVGAVVLSAVVVVATALVILALRASAQTFRVATWTGALLSVAIAMGGALRLRRRWLDLQAVAFLADRRGGLRDRLATLVDLRRRPSRLAPILVGQTLAMGAQWRPERVAPRQLGRPLFALIASLLALASTAFLGRPAPPSAPGAVAVADESRSAEGAALPEVPLGSSGRAAGDRDAPGGGLPSPANLLPQGVPAAGGSAFPEAGGRRPKGLLAALPDRLQKAIRRAFHGRAVGRPHQRAALSPRRGGEATAQRGSGKDKRDGRRRSPFGAAKAGLQRRAHRGAGTGRHWQPGRQAGRHGGQPNGPAAPERNRAGASQAAGSGSSPGGLLQRNARVAAAGQQGGPKTFKLTITSFLRAVERKGNRPGQRRKQTGGTGALGSGRPTRAILNRRQLADDVLRKAEIPPEYEDIVRRVYSLRANR